MTESEALEILNNYHFEGDPTYKRALKTAKEALKRERNTRLIELCRFLQSVNYLVDEDIYYLDKKILNLEAKLCSEDFMELVYLWSWCKLYPGWAPFKYNLMGFINELLEG